MSTAMILGDEIKRRGISNRQAAREIGVSHTTINRILDGMPADFDTIMLVAKWLKVEPAVLIDAGSLDKSALPAKITALVEREPELARVFEEALDRIESGEASSDLIRDIVAYASYKLNLKNP